MVLSVSDVRTIITKVCARTDVLNACRKRDLGTVIAVLGAHGVTQGQISGLTGIPQGRLSEYMTHKRVPRASSTFQAFADGVGMPSAAREALGLAPDSPGQSAAIGRQSPGGAVPDAGLSYPDTPTQATDNLAQLWQADLSDAVAPWGQADPGPWNDASLRWLVDPGRQPDSGAAGAVRIGMADIERFRATVDLFVQLDNRFGGGHARAALVQYLSIDAERLLAGGTAKPPAGRCTRRWPRRPFWPPG